MISLQLVLQCMWVVGLALPCTEGLKISIPPGTRLAPYARDQYRQLPYEAIGIYSKDSFVAHLSGHTDLHPLIEVSVDATGGPARFFQVYIYNADVVEGVIMPSTQHAVSPCMDIGQSHGVSIFANMSHDAWRLNAGAFMVGTASAYSSFAVRDRVYLESTGLYIVTMNACQFINRTNTPSVRDLNVEGWADMSISGTITVRNPYGYLPGQFYGFLPGYSCLFALSVVVFLIFCAFALRVGWRQMLRYQWLIAALLALSVCAYLFLVAYYTRLNEENVDAYPVFVIGTLLCIVRNTVGVVTLVLLCGGYGLIHKSLSTFKILLCLAGGVTRCALNVTEFALFQVSTNLGATTGMWGVSSLQSPNLGWKVSRVFGMMVDTVFGLVAVVCLWYTVKQLERSALKRRLALYRRTAVALILGSVCGLVWAALVTNLSDGPLGAFGEAHWKIMWLPTIIYELVYLSTFSSLAMIWLPRSSDLYNLIAEDAPSRDSRQSAASSVTFDSTRGREVSDRGSLSSSQEVVSHDDVELASVEKIE